MGQLGKYSIKHQLVEEEEGIYFYYKEKNRWRVILLQRKKKFLIEISGIFLQKSQVIVLGGL